MLPSHELGALLSLLYLASKARATGEPCQISNSKLDPNSHKFRSDCGPQDYCAVSLANSGSISAAIKSIPSDNKASSSQLTRRTSDALSYHHHHSGFSPYKHETRLSRRGELHNIFLAAVSDTYANDTITSEDATQPETPMISEKDDGAPSPFGLNTTGTCQPKGCRKDEFPFGCAKRIFTKFARSLACTELIFTFHWAGTDTDRMIFSHRDVR